MAKTAGEKDQKDNSFILIIDEINRANLAAVLGECIYALEYRGCAVKTPYAVDGNEELVIPPNLYLIGTMNTADRSIGHIDYAVRRRFAFVPLLPDRQIIEHQSNDDIVIRSALTLFDAVKKLFDERGYLAPDFHRDDVQVGHTYFLAEDSDDLFMKFTYQVYPLLREYYKDGVLVPKDRRISLEINGKPLQLDEAVAPEEIMKFLKQCFLSQNSSSQAAQTATVAG